jgi:hypothetical protein
VPVESGRIVATRKIYQPCETNIADPVSVCVGVPA